MKDIKKLYKDGISSCACNILGPLKDESLKSADELLLAIIGVWEGLRTQAVLYLDECKNDPDANLNYFFGQGSEDCTRVFISYFTEFRKRFPEASDKLDDAVKEIGLELIDLSSKYLHGVDYSKIFSFFDKAGVSVDKLYGKHKPESDEFLVKEFCSSKNVSGDLCEVSE